MVLPLVPRVPPLYALESVGRGCVGRGARRHAAHHSENEQRGADSVERQNVRVRPPHETRRCAAPRVNTAQAAARERAWAAGARLYTARGARRAQRAAMAKQATVPGARVFDDMADLEDAFQQAEAYAATVVRAPHGPGCPRPCEHRCAHGKTWKICTACKTEIAAIVAAAGVTARGAARRAARGAVLSAITVKAEPQ